MEKVIKEHYYEENEISERIKLLKKELNEYNIELPKALELSRELDELIVMYMKKEKQVKQVK